MKSVEDNVNYHDNWSKSSAILSVSMSTRCGASSGCGARDGDQILRVAGNILNKDQGTSGKGFPPVLWLGVLLIVDNITADCVTEYFTKPGARAYPLERCKDWT